MNPSDTIFTSTGPVATFVFNRPDTGNAMTWAMYDALLAACDRVDADAGLRAFVIRSAGGTFGTGTDIGQFTGFASGEDGLDYERRLERCLDRLEAVAVPTVAVVEGIAAGAACVIALACDLRVCTPAARFGVPIARTLGNAVSVANAARLVDHLGLARTKDLLLAGRFIDVSEAAAAGVVTRLAEPPEIDRVLAELTATLSGNAPLTLREMKAALREVSRHRRAGLAGLDDLVAACYASHDFREGVDAFLAKRPPVFTGR